jgi:carboxyl-terminal processing protease
MLSLDDFSTSLGDFVEKAKAYIVGKENTEIGALKITIQKFYRINGGSTQLNGVTPDIILPSAYEDLEIGERKDKAALKWDEIAPASYTKMNRINNKAALIAASQKRVNLNPLFTFVKQTNEKLKKKEQYNYVQLRYDDYKSEMDEAAGLSKKAEELQKKNNNLNITNLNADLAKVNLDSTSITKNKEWLKNLNKDIYLSEAVQIIRDIK